MRRRSRRDPLRSVATLLLLVGCGGGGGDDATPDPTSEPPPPARTRCTEPAPVEGVPELGFERLSSGFTRPVFAEAPPGAPESAVVVGEQDGVLRWVENGEIRDEPYLDLSGRVLSWLEPRASPEEGLLGLAFHPEHATDGRLYVNYSRSDHATELVELAVDPADPTRVDVDSLRVVLVVPQRTGTHHGGALAFDASGALLLSLGDGGDVPGVVPGTPAQDLGTLYGSVLRIDVDRARPYSVPASNPFVDTPGARPEIWAFGMRNPWRIHVDAATGWLWIADVGQARREEVNVVRPGDAGANLGWPILEGEECYSGDAEACAREDLSAPVLSYGHEDGCAITGGPVYRGARMPGHAGRYFYGDFCSGLVRSFVLEDGIATGEGSLDAVAAEAGIDGISSFGTDACGEVLVADYLDGELFRIVPVPVTDTAASRR